MPSPVVFVLKGYPRLSESFIAQEIRGLERRGLDIRIVSLRRPTERLVHPVHREIAAPVSYLPEYLYQQPLRVLAAWRRQRRRPGYRAARRAWLRDLRRDRTANRIRRFGQALVLADELPAGAVRLHAHFLHTPASVARYAALLAHLPWSCSAHAKDIWTTPRWEIAEKLAAAAWIVTCTGHGRDHLAGLAPASHRPDLVYHGLDFARFPAPPPKPQQRDGSAAADPVLILTVGRAVEKKGFGDLLDALAALPASLSWRLRHIGGGPLLASLQAQAQTLGLAARIEWLGTQSQDVVLQQLRAADLFVLASRIAADGDRDGLPNVLMEAQSQKVPVVATTVSAIPEFVVHGQTGLLVAPAQPRALAAALQALITDPGRRSRFGEAGFARVRTHFDAAAGLDRLAAKFGLAKVQAPADASCA